jgi:hypothetical protein
VWDVALVEGTREDLGSQRTLTETNHASYINKKEVTAVGTDNKIHTVKRETSHQNIY